MLGRVDEISFNDKAGGFYLVKDDFGVNVMYDASFLDMVSLEKEILKTGSFYIQKLEPLID